MNAVFFRKFRIYRWTSPIRPIPRRSKSPLASPSRLMAPLRTFFLSLQQWYITNAEISRIGGNALPLALVSTASRFGATAFAPLPPYPRVRLEKSVVCTVRAGGAGPQLDPACRRCASAGQAGPEGTVSAMGIGGGGNLREVPGPPEKRHLGVPGRDFGAHRAKRSPQRC